MPREADYDAIRKMAKNLRDLCSVNHVPMMFTFAKEEKGETVYESEIITPIQLGVTLSDDRFSKLNVAFSKGFYIRFKDNVLDNIDAGNAYSQMMDMMEDEDDEEFPQE